MCYGFVCNRRFCVVVKLKFRHFMELPLCCGPLLLLISVVASFLKFRACILSVYAYCQVAGPVDLAESNLQDIADFWQQNCFWHFRNDKPLFSFPFFPCCVLTRKARGPTALVSLLLSPRLVVQQHNLTSRPRFHSTRARTRTHTHTPESSDSSFI